MKKKSQRIEEYFDRLWLIPRSITGPGFRRSLDILDESGTNIVNAVSMGWHFVTPIKNIESAFEQKVIY